MVLDRAFQKTKPKPVAPPPPAPKPRLRRDSAREPWEAQYDQVDEPEPAAAEQEEEEEMNLATLLNVIDGSAFLVSPWPCRFCTHPQQGILHLYCAVTFNALFSYCELCPDLTPRT